MCFLCLTFVFKIPMLLRLFIGSGAPAGPEGNQRPGGFAGRLIFMLSDHLFLRTSTTYSHCFLLYRAYLLRSLLVTYTTIL